MPMTPAQAHVIWNILVAHAGASDSESCRRDFVQAQVHGCDEYRFQGLLGFGGKFWAYRGRLYVTCYPEDETPERRWMMDETNRDLKSLEDHPHA